MNNIYFFPIPKAYKNSMATENPYCYNYMAALSKHFHIINTDDRSNWPSTLKIAKSIFKMNTIIVNWPENILLFKGGRLQAIIFIALLRIMYFRNIQIVWMFHNLQSHHVVNKYTRLVFKNMYKFSSLIITHSKEALYYLDDKTTTKRLFFHHPIKEFRFTESKQFKVDSNLIDIFIWGTIIPYKGIKEFLQFLYTRNLQNKYNIVIIGKCADTTYSMELDKYCNKNIYFENRSAAFEELQIKIPQSRYVLFPYLGGSISSSGALIDTVVMNGTPLGPNRGAFKDLNEESVCLTYDNYDELLAIIDGNNNISEECRKQFITANSWEPFVENMVKEINGLKLKTSK